MKKLTDIVWPLIREMYLDEIKKLEIYTKG